MLRGAAEDAEGRGALVVANGAGRLGCALVGKRRKFLNEFDCLCVFECIEN